MSCTKCQKMQLQLNIFNTCHLKTRIKDYFAVWFLAGYSALLVLIEDITQGFFLYLCFLGLMTKIRISHLVCPISDRRDQIVAVAGDNEEVAEHQLTRNAREHS